ncbi:flagellar basal body P-ring formation chaperone FlgA [Alteromonas facilis]|uniref:flagellar basal body P-ring formation chaperone FlgA n=1 Tax=Alteromonas facilis TaxID=2048004 RepID=UPI000C287FD4|nr:flagellar basal body P-ring formation chaperone FlgA [Alteromonas facilis]
MKNLNSIKIPTFFLFMAASGLPATASNDLSLHELIEQQTEAFVTQALENQSEYISNRQTLVDVFPIDRRVSVEPCQNAYQFDLSDNALTSSYATVKVSCPATDWYLFVNAKIEQTQAVVVTSEMLSPGSILTQQNLRLADISSKSLRYSTFDDVDQLIGARLKYRVRPDQPIKPNMVCFVCKGDLITLSAKADGLSISTKAVAQEDGNIGDTIQVKNRRSDKIVLAKVENVDTATIEI